MNLEIRHAITEAALKMDERIVDKQTQIAAYVAAVEQALILL